eukprot:gene41397-16707_t
MDGALVADTRASIQMVIMNSVLLWLAVERVESFVLAGLFSAAWEHDEGVIRACSCAEPPCAIPPFSGFVSWVGIAVVA